MSLVRYGSEQPLTIHKQHGSLLHNFRRYITHIDRCVSEFDAELSLQNRGVKFVYLIDFQEIYSYLAPYLLHPEERRPFLNRHLQARELLSKPVERIFFPLGTLAEVSAYVQRLRRRIESLHKITLSTNLDRALDEFLLFFRQEQFLDRKRAKDWLEISADLGGESRLFSLQAQALDLLSDFEVGASMLQKLLAFPSVGEVQEAIRQYPLDINTVHYRNFLHELQQIRSRQKKRDLSESDFSNMVDAANTSMALSLNDRFSRENNSGVPWMFFKVVTDTRSLFRLSDLFERQLIYRDYYGFDLNLFETARDVLFKRFLRMSGEIDGRNLISALTSSAGTVRNALRDLEFLAADFRVTPEQMLEDMVAPSAGELPAPVAQHLQKLLEGVRGVQVPQNLLQRRLFEAEVRDELGDGQRSSEAVERPYSARGVAALQGLLQSVEQTIHNLDDIKVAFNPVQKAFRKGVWNPLLTVESLGFEKKISRDDGEKSTCLTLRRKKTGELVFQVDLRPEVCTFSWPTSVSLHEQLPILGTLFGRSKEILGLIIYFDGKEARVKEWEELESLADERYCCFVRLDTRALSYVTEMFSADSDYVLMSGLIMPPQIQKADILLMVQFFAAMSSAYLPDSLITDTLSQFFRGSVRYRRT